MKGITAKAKVQDEAHSFGYETTETGGGSNTYKNLFSPTSGIYISSLPPGALRREVSLVVASGLPRSVARNWGYGE